MQRLCKKLSCLPPFFKFPVDPGTQCKKKKSPWNKFSITKTKYHFDKKVQAATQVGKVKVNIVQRGREFGQLPKSALEDGHASSGQPKIKLLKHR